MSHSLSVKASILEMDTLRKALSKLDFVIKAITETHDVDLYDRTLKDALAEIELKGWKYPIAVDATGNLVYDDYKGNWGNVDDVHEINQEYSSQIASDELQAQGIFAHSRTTNEAGELIFEYYV